MSDQELDLGLPPKDPAAGPWLISPGPVEEYGEWGCHMCFAKPADISIDLAERAAREHLAETGHDVYVVRGTSQALHAVRTEAAQ